MVNPLSANPTKWLNTLKQFIGNLQTNCLSMFDHFMGLSLERLTKVINPTPYQVYIRYLFQNTVNCSPSSPYGIMNIKNVSTASRD